jgi:hypothetical protein
MQIQRFESESTTSFTTETQVLFFFMETLKWELSTDWASLQRKF